MALINKANIINISKVSRLKWHGPFRIGAKFTKENIVGPYLKKKRKNVLL